MFIELRGASTIDRPVPVPVTAPPPPIAQLSVQKRTRLLSGREGAEQLSKSHTPPHRSPVVQQIVCPRLQLWIFGFDYPAPPPQSAHTPKPRVLVIVVIRRPLCDRGGLHRKDFSLLSLFGPSSESNDFDLRLF